MADFDKKQMEILKGNYSIIAKSCGVTREYVVMVLSGQRKKKSQKAQEIVNKANAVIEVLKN